VVTFPLVSPGTLSVTHIFEGEEVVTGGEDGQVWIATFASAPEARIWVDAMKAAGLPVQGLRQCS
jgi:hypothetical protein